MATNQEIQETKKSSRIAAIIDQLGSPRIVKAFVVYSFGLTALLLMLAGREVPQLLSTVILIFVGVIFESVVSQARNGNT